MDSLTPTLTTSHENQPAGCPCGSRHRHVHPRVHPPVRRSRQRQRQQNPGHARRMAHRLPDRGADRHQTHAHLGHQLPVDRAGLRDHHAAGHGHAEGRTRLRDPHPRAWGHFTEFERLHHLLPHPLPHEIQRFEQLGNHLRRQADRFDRPATGHREADFHRRKEQGHGIRRPVLQQRFLADLLFLGERRQCAHAGQWRYLPGPGARLQRALPRAVHQTLSRRLEKGPHRPDGLHHLHGIDPRPDPEEQHRL